MSRPVFVHKFHHRALRYLPRPVRPLGFQTRLDVRPKRFAVGLTERVRWNELTEAHEAPVNAAFYLGRVLEMTASGEVLAAIWEYPSGREARVTLPAQDFRGTAPPRGAVLRIWTWVELPGQGEVTPRRRVKVRPVEPHEEEERKQRLQALLESLPEGDEDET